MAYKAEHSQGQLSLWRIELIRNCSRQISFWNDLRYLFLIVQRFLFRRLTFFAWHSWHWFIASLTLFFKSEEAVSSADLQSFHESFREESLKSRHKGRFRTLNCVTGSIRLNPLEKV